MRDYPWNQRTALLKHHRWFRNLMDFHSITRAWIEECQPKGGATPQHSPHYSEDLKLLETLPDARLELLLDDTSPEDLLTRLEHSVWSVQGWTYSTLSDRQGGKGATPAAASTLWSTLEQATWKQGQAVAEKRWQRIGESSRSDLRAIFLTMIDSPIALSLGEDAFLLKRGLPTHIEFEFRACPHDARFPETTSSTDELCALHSAWIRGYLYGLNPKAQLEYLGRNADRPRCSQIWKIMT
jgi:hypothetical protein